MTSYTHRIDEFSFALKIELGLLEGAEASLLWRWVEELAANDPTIAVQEYHISIVSVSGMYRMIPSTYRKPIVTAVSGACIVSCAYRMSIVRVSGAYRAYRARTVLVSCVSKAYCMHTMSVSFTYRPSIACVSQRATCESRCRAYNVCSIVYVSVCIVSYRVRIMCVRIVCTYHGRTMGVSWAYARIMGVSHLHAVPSRNSQSM